jgi:hypothetical protein
MAHFRVVDFEERSLVPLFASCKYAASSYVWGNWERNKTLNTMATVAGLQVRGSICHDDLTFPATIGDALYLCHQLRVEYLWVDSLCIVVQDEATSKHLQIQHMDAVYQAAAFTIIAADGLNADAGLPGLDLSKAGCVRQQAADIHGLSLISRSPRPTIEDEVWATRAWTSQGDYMSRRKLFFHGNHVWFRISSGLENLGLEENTFPLPFSEVQQLVSILQTRDAETNRDTEATGGFSEYSSLVEPYTERRLGYPSDIINAFGGLLRHLSAKYQTTFVQALPLSVLDISLLWLPKSRVTRRIASGSPVAPSWSWAGWMGSGIRYQLTDPIHLGRIAWEDAEIAKARERASQCPLAATMTQWRPSNVIYRQLTSLTETFYSCRCSAPSLCYTGRGSVSETLEARTSNIVV